MRGRGVGVLKVAEQKVALALFEADEQLARRSDTRIGRQNTAWRLSQMAPCRFGALAAHNVAEGGLWFELNDYDFMRDFAGVLKGEGDASRRHAIGTLKRVVDSSNDHLARHCLARTSSEGSTER
jgi:hypothetical protein